MPKTTVILPAFNVAPHLRACLKALEAERAGRTDVEVLVVDNNSTDDTVAIARDFPGVQTLHQSKQGSYAARNLGIGASEGDVIVFLDPDCAPCAGWLDAALAALDDPAVEIVLGRRHYGETRALKLLEWYEDEKIQWILRSGGADQVYGYTNNMAVRRSLFDRFGLFQERMRGGDTMFVQRVVHALGSQCVRFAPRMAVDHLEVRTLDAYYDKRTIYGASNERLSREVDFRPLSSVQRFRVLASAVRRRRIGPLQAAWLAALLVPGAIAYERARRGVQ